MQPEVFSAGWDFFGLAIIALTLWVLFDINRTGIPIHDDDDDDWGIDVPRESPEADARNRPF